MAEQFTTKFLQCSTTIWLEFGENATLSLVKASDYGMLGLNSDLLLLTDYVHDSTVVCKAELFTLENTHDNMFNTSLDSLNFVTEFSFGGADSVHSGHLEQLALACWRDIHIV